MDEQLEVGDQELIDQFANLFSDEPEEVSKEMEVDLEGMEITGEDTISEKPEELVSEEETEEDGETEEVIETVDPEGLFLIEVGDEKTHVSVKDLSASYKDEQARREEWSKIENVKVQWLDQSRKLVEAMQLAKREAEVILEDANKADWESMSPEEFKANALQRKRLQQKVDLINSRVKDIGGEVQRHDSEKNRLQILNARQRLEREVAGFNDEVYSSALAHGVNVLGIDQDVALGLKDAGIIKLLIEHHRGYVNPVKTKPISMPKKTVKPVKAAKATKEGFIDGNPDLPVWAQDIW